jgi:hypothetical protein
MGGCFYGVRRRNTSKTSKTLYFFGTTHQRSRVAPSATGPLTSRVVVRYDTVGTTLAAD